MEEFKTFIGVMLLLSGLMIYFAATDPYIGKTELAKEKTVFEYRFSKYDPIIHKIFVNIKAEDEIEVTITNEVNTKDPEKFEYNGKEIDFVKTTHGGELWTLKISNKKPMPVLVEYDARITCYSYVYGGIILTAIGFLTLLMDNIKKRNTQLRPLKGK